MPILLPCTLKFLHYVTTDVRGGEKHMNTEIMLVGISSFSHSLAMNVAAPH